MNDNAKPGDGILWLRVFHKILMTGIILVIAMALYSIYMHVVYPVTQAPQEDIQVTDEEQGQTKPLPDYMLEGVGPDELEVLKP